MSKHSIIDTTLEKIIPPISSFKKIDEAVYIYINEDLLMKVELVYTSKINQFDAVKCTIINKKYGVVDSNTIKFAAVFSPKIGPGKIVYNYIWHAIKDWEWYLQEPNKNEFNALQEMINNYIEIYK